MKLLSLIFTAVIFAQAGAFGAEKPVVTLARFALVSPGIYRGSQPKTMDDFKVLQSHQIRTIIDLQSMPWDIDSDDDNAELFAIENVFHAPIMGDWKKPDEAVVNRALSYLRQNDLRPIYIHCKLGRDRTSLIVGLHRIFNEGWSPARAELEMDQFGFSHSIWLRGLSEYFEDHAFGPNPFGGPINK